MRVRLLAQALLPLVMSGFLAGCSAKAATPKSTGVQSAVVGNGVADGTVRSMVACVTDSGNCNSALSPEAQRVSNNAMVTAGSSCLSAATAETSALSGEAPLATQFGLTQVTTGIESGLAALSHIRLSCRSELNAAVSYSLSNRVMGPEDALDAKITSNAADVAKRLVAEAVSMSKEAQDIATAGPKDSGTVKAQLKSLASLVQSTEDMVSKADADALGAEPGVKLDQSGSGSRSPGFGAPTFFADGPWTLKWSYSCTGLNAKQHGAQGDGFIVLIDPRALGVPGVFQGPYLTRQPRGSGHHQYQGGIAGGHFLEIDSPCEWHVVVTRP